MDGYGYNPTLVRIWRALTSSFSLGTWFGVHVRMFWAALLLVPLVMLGRFSSLGGGMGLLLTAIYFVSLFLIIWTHEMGHIACGWRFGIRTDVITLGPLGGLAHMNSAASSPREEVWISLAGPAVHLVWLAIFQPIEWLLPLEAQGTWYGWTVWLLNVTNLTLMIFNLLPIFPLDGGRVLRALLAMRVHPNRATLWAANVGMIGGGVLVVLALTRPDIQSSVGLVIGVMCILRSLDEKRMAKHVAVYGQAIRREPWEQDPDAWKHGAADFSADERRPGWLARRRQARAERRASAAAEAARELDRKVDEVLARVSEVGVSGLSAQEKAVLKKASQRHRGTG